MISSRRAMGTEMECVPILGCWGVGHSHRLSTIQAGSARQPTWTRPDQKGVLYLCTQSTVDMSVCMYRTVLKRTSQSQKQKRGTVRTRKSNRESEGSSAARPRTQTTGRTYLNRTPPRYRQWQASRPPFAHCPHLRRPNSFFFLTLVTTSGTPAADTGDGASPPPARGDGAARVAPGGAVRSPRGDAAAAPPPRAAAGGAFPAPPPTFPPAPPASDARARAALEWAIVSAGGGCISLIRVTGSSTPARASR